MLTALIRFAIVAFLAVGSVAAQTTRHVPAQYKTIQAAIDASSDFDSVVVAPGTYHENILFKGKQITVTSSHGATRTTLDGGRRSYVVEFTSKNSRVTVLNGFTVTRGLGVRAGGMFLNGGAPTISGNIVTRNKSQTSGGGIGGGHGELILNNVICYNVVRNRSASTFPPAFTAGGGISAGGFRSQIVGNLIYANECHSDGPYAWAEGGGLYAWKARLHNNTIVGNRVFAKGPGARAKGGGLLTTNSAVIRNCIVWGNQATTGPQIAGHDPRETLNVQYNCVQGGFAGTGNLSADPRFIDPGRFDLHLRHDSPCRDVAFPICCLPSVDFEGDPRITGGKLDMGADEFHPHLYHVDEAKPGSTVRIRFIGTPGRSAIWGLGKYTLTTPVGIPGLAGQLHLHPYGLAMVPLGTVPTAGWIDLPLHLPSGFPLGPVPMQALIGTHLTNLHVVEVE